MFRRIMNGTTTVGDAYLVGILMFVLLLVGIGLGAFIA